MYSTGRYGIRTLGRELSKYGMYSREGKEFTFDVIGHSKATTGTQTHSRLMIRIPSLKLGLRQVNNLEMAIVESRDKSTNVLINRETLSNLGYVVSSRQTHILTPEMEKIKIV